MNPTPAPAKTDGKSLDDSIRNEWIKFTESVKLLGGPGRESALAFRAACAAVARAAQSDESSIDVAFLKAQLEQRDAEIKTLLAAQSDDGWISVDDRLPELKSEILAYTLNGEFFSSTRYVSGHAYTKTQVTYFVHGISGEKVDDEFPVTHWRPLPPPPEEVSK